MNQHSNNNKQHTEDADVAESTEINDKEATATQDVAVENEAEEMPAAPPVEQELTDRVADVEKLKKELDTVQDKLLRQAAEYQNYRRRTEQEKSGLVDFGKVVVIQELLDVIDDFDRSMEAAESIKEEESTVEAYRSLRDGVTLVYKKLMEKLSRLGVEPIEAVGKPFHVDEHEAMMQQPAPEGTEPGIVLSEFQKGYRMGDRVLRHSKVVVSA